MKSQTNILREKRFDKKFDKFYVYKTREHPINEYETAHIETVEFGEYLEVSDVKEFIQSEINRVIEKIEKEKVDYPAPEEYYEGWNDALNCITKYLNK